jgi:saccharopepsin
VSYGETDFRPHAISIHIPLDPTADGTMSLIPITPELFQTTSQMNWIDTQTPGDEMPVSHIGVRKGGAISEEIYTVRLALETPYISIPSDIYDIVALATNPVVDPDSNGLDSLVDCSEMGRFPDLFVGLDPEKEPNMFEEITEVDDREIVITPSQYIMETKPGRCVLLVKKNPEQDSEEAVLGWAAIRGKHVVLDWVNERTGFEI